MLSGKYAVSYFKLGAPTAWDDDLITRIGDATGAKRDALFEELNTYVVDQAWNAPWTVLANAYATAKDVKVTPQPGTQYPPIYNYAPTK